MVIMLINSSAVTSPPTNRPPPAARESDTCVSESQSLQALVTVNVIPLTAMENGA